MSVSLSTNIEAKVRERATAWLTNARDLLTAEGIDRESVLFVLWGEQHGFASFLLAAFIKRVYIILTASDLYVIRTKWLNCWRKIDSKRYNVTDLAAVKVRPGFLADTVRLAFHDGTTVKMVGVDKGAAEPLQRVAAEGIDVIAKS
ncbi:MAG: hypothetical protein FJ276_09460 [Planctomycetes bacterium]|nr:hypothetical protein [Planctomycetota bacterium]